MGGLGDILSATVPLLTSSDWIYTRGLQHHCSEILMMSSVSWWNTVEPSESVILTSWSETRWAVWSCNGFFRVSDDRGAYRVIQCVTVSPLGGLIDGDSSRTCGISSSPLLNGDSRLWYRGTVLVCLRAAVRLPESTLGLCLSSTGSTVRRSPCDPPI